MIKITVITVCYNAEKEIEKTVCSVLNQTYSNIEYIIIDGKSSDSTVELIRRLICDSDKNVNLYSERDFGTYNAMNRGIVRARGDYVVFMNAGDLFYDDNVLTKAVSYIESNGPAIYFGKAYIENCTNTRKRIADFTKMKKSYLGAILHGFMPCHQSIIAPLNSLKKTPFDEEYILRADFDWFVKCYRNGIRIINMDFIVSRYDNRGKTARLSVKSKMNDESKSILHNHYPILSRVSSILY